MERYKQRSAHYHILLVVCEMYKCKAGLHDHVSEISFARKLKNTLVSRDHYPLIKHILIGWCKIFPLCMLPSGLFILHFTPMAVA